MGSGGDEERSCGDTPSGTGKDRGSVGMCRFW